MAGFRIGQSYPLRYIRKLDEMRIELDNARAGVGPLVMSVAKFKKWFWK